MSTPILKNYFSYHELLLDISKLSEDFDFEKTAQKAPPMAFYTKDGRIILGGTFTHFMQRLKDELGLPVCPSACEDHRGYYIVSYEDFSPVEKKELEDTIEIKPVDTPARKRSLRKTTK